MPPPRLILYIAASLDGFIATKTGDVSWLEPFGDATAGFAPFMSTVGASIMGRHTYEFVRQFAPPAPPDAPPTYVLTNRPLDASSPSIRPFSGDVRALDAQARRHVATLAPGKDIWLVGGGQTLAAFHAAQLIDLYRIFLIPVTLGQGLPLFPQTTPTTTPLRLLRTDTFPSGVVELVYEPARQPPHAPA